ncbi:cytochrome b561 and DOMON domain-containing protein At3g61750-like [Impatiens glandulifera]|uniref:cytochrome b561 and DOMON domain-containing protein At3g61750-like n=1 Tax=Impatiens glandulifera TaxID=253017 RepID=UPI001FB07E5F|nr:cytochrome b561 and DOMON domain-containing protein At3g61750-like [Impatiens glandulifera]
MNLSCPLQWKISHLGFMIFLSLCFARSATGLNENEDLGARRCKNDLSTILPSPYNVNSPPMICSPIWSTFVIQYSQNNDNVVNIIISAIYKTGWVGMGFSENGFMYNSSAMVGWADLEDKLNIKQYYLNGFQPESIIPDSGDLPLTKVPVAVAIDKNTMYLAFQLNFSSTLSRQHILLAYGTNQPDIHNLLTHHDDKTTVLFDFTTGKIAVLRDSVFDLKKTHGILGIVAWGILAPMGAISARYFKHKDPLWYYLHVTFQITTSIVGMMTVVAGLTLYDSLHIIFPQHRIIGMLVLVLCVVQLVGGFARPTKYGKTRKYWNWFHHWVGRIAIIFGNLNIVLGINHADDGTIWKVGYGFILWVLLITIIVLEITSMSKARMKKPEMIEISNS